MNKQVHIFYPRVINVDGNSMSVGGIQNYLIGLAEALSKKNFNVYIIQNGIKNFSSQYNGCTIIGYKANLKVSLKKQIRHLFNQQKSQINPADLIIWGSDRMAIKISHKFVIAIQHGISFDYIPYESLKFAPILKYSIFSSLYKFLQRQKAINDFKKTKNIVCVDYNYLNWIRTMIKRKHTNGITVIPNFSETIKKPNIIETGNIDKIKIIFARRFQVMRGVYILIDIVKEITSKYSNVEFTICGEGPLKKVLESEIGSFSNVIITKYNIGEASLFNLKHHISLIPTYGSEGTSFSLLESMSAGTIPLASNVGGMTNIIIDEFNGFLINPSSEDFVSKLSYLIDNPQLLQKLSTNAKMTTNLGFNKSIWEKKWINVIENLYKK